MIKLNVCQYINLDQNRVNLVFEITEGKEAKIRRINFINNEVFSDSTLEDVNAKKMKSKKNTPEWDNAVTALTKLNELMKNLKGDENE